MRFLPMITMNAEYGIERGTRYWTLHCVVSSFFGSNNGALRITDVRVISLYTLSNIWYLFVQQWMGESTQDCKTAPKLKMNKKGREMTKCEQKKKGNREPSAVFLGWACLCLSSCSFYIFIPCILKKIINLWSLPSSGQIETITQ